MTSEGDPHGREWEAREASRPLAGAVDGVVAQAKARGRSSSEARARLFACDPATLKRERVGMFVGSDGGIEWDSLAKDRFGINPHWLAVRVAQMATGGDRTAAAILVLLSLSWNWHRPLIAAWPSYTTLAHQLNVRKATVCEAFAKLERWGLLRRLTRDDRDLLADSGIELPRNPQIVVWILQSPASWAPWDEQDAYVLAMSGGSQTPRGDR